MPKVSDYASHQPATVRRTDSVFEAAALMRDRHVGCVIVVDGPSTAPRPIGMLTDRDIVVGVLAQTDRALHLAKVDDVMTLGVLEATSSDDLSDTLVAMRAKGVRRVPVVSAEGVLVGVLSFDDVLDYVHDQVSDLAALIGREQRRERRVRPTE